MKTVDVLIAAKALITNESTYRKGSFTPGRTVGGVYKTASGEDTLKLKEATCFCSLGAINAAVGADAESGAYGLIDQLDTDYHASAGITPPTKAQREAFNKAKSYLQGALEATNGSRSIIGMNDGSPSFGEPVGLTRHQFVLQVFDLAIKNAKRRHIRGDHSRTRTAQKAVSL